uniref:Uncharacterized protein n=1 Tax=Arundo donax TaxID=35708 RepID=A0A0A9D9U3_ARUDO
MFTKVPVIWYFSFINCSAGRNAGILNELTQLFLFHLFSFLIIPILLSLFVFCCLIHTVCWLCKLNMNV